MRPPARSNKLIPIIVGLVLLASCAVVLIARHGKGAGTKATLTSESPATSPAKDTDQSTETAPFNKKQFSLTDPTSLWVVANKHNALQPKSYAPTDLVVPGIPLRLGSSNEEMHLRKPAADALVAMVTAAKKQNISLMLASGYRSYNFQVSLYNRYVQQQGQAIADSQSARPGFSEHQTGLAADLEPAARNCEVEACFAATPEGKWLAANAHTYGFIIRYPEGKQSTTGYIYEPWHVRFIGNDLAAEMHDTKTITLEDFFGLAAAPDYN